MTDGLDQAMADAGLNLLRADDGISPPLNIIDGPVQNPTPPLPYVVAWCTDDWPEDDPGYDSLDNRSTHAVMRWFLHIEAENAVQWRAIAQRVRAKLLNQRPVIAGMQPGLIKLEAGGAPPEPNEVLGSPVVSAVRVYRLTCTV